MSTAPPAVLHPCLVRGLEELFGVAHEPHLEAELEGDLQLDSLATVELQVWLEDAVGVRIAPSGDAAPPRTLGDLQALLDAALRRGTATATPPRGSR
ncbi:MAG TPA: acyl carrier protein [Egibacteraceae bacterium]|nr:acyl carrier protein [Egibacteraceae bacterium]